MKVNTQNYLMSYICQLNYYKNIEIMKITCKKTGKDMTSKVINQIEKSLEKDYGKIVTVSTSDPELLSKEKYEMWVSYHNGEITI